jgi:nicotinamide-nucleotide amidase
MKVGILNIGTELLFGQVINSNAAFLSKELNNLGFDVLYHHIVGDNPLRIKAAINMLFIDCDIIVTTGGLGPTQDDITKEIVCELMNDSLVKNQIAYNNISEIYSKSNRIMPKNNIKQSYLPRRAIPFFNDAGTAPGFALEHNGKYVISLPGPPREMTSMFESRVRPYLKDHIDGHIYYKVLRTFGIGESSLEMKLIDLIDKQQDPTIATYAKEGECSLRITSKRSTMEEAENAVNNMIKKVDDLIGEYIYSQDDEDFNEVIVKLLKTKGLKLSCSESCTGGLFAKLMTDISGSSEVFDRGIITYSNKAKIEELGVDPKTLKKFGAVSRETAEEMVLGLRNKTKSDVCISVTGISGPMGGSEEKPVGLVYIGIYYNNEIEVKEIISRDINRKWNRNYTALNMLKIVYDTIS